MRAKKTTGMLMAMAVAVTALLWITGCATGGVPSAQQMPEGASYSGLWYSEQFEHMYLHQDGDQVTGVYVYGGGGKLEGEVDGNLLVFSWEEPGDRQQARQSMSGKGYFQLQGQGDDLRLVGEWGYGDDHRGAGPWEAEFIREHKEDDPKTLEELN